MLDERTKDVLPIFDSLNVLGSTPWVVNKDILDVSIEAFTNQKAYAKYLKKLSIPMDPNLVEIPEPPEELKQKIRLKKIK